MPMVIRQGGTNAAHHANRMIRQSGDVARQNMMLQQMRRSAVFTIVPPAQPRTTSIGLEVTKTFTINEAQVSDGVFQYELLEDGAVIWSGMGDDRVDGLLKIMMRLTEGEEPNHPNN